MLSYWSIRFIKSIFRIVKIFFSIIPIEANKTGLHKISGNPVYWRSQWAFFTILSGLQLLTHWNNLIFMLFQSAILLMHSASLGCTLTFELNCVEICQLLNYLFGKTKTNAGRVQRQIKGFLFGLILLIFSGGLLLMVWTIIPLTYILFPELLQVNVPWVPEVISAILSSKFVGLALKLVQFLPIGVSAAATSALALTVVVEVKVKILALQKIVLELNSRLERFETMQRFGLCYREIHVLVIIANQCCQKQIWPTTMFCGSTTIILLLYPMLAYGKLLPGLFIFGFCSFAAIFTVITIFLLHLCSEPLAISCSILKKAGKYCGSSGYNKKLIKSCALIKMKVGAFHEMDKGRVFAYVRFILQRTAFLAMKCKSM